MLFQGQSKKHRKRIYAYYRARYEQIIETVALPHATQLLISNSFATGTDLQSMDQRRYIDPGNYLDLMELLSTFTTEIERSKTKLDRLIGQGKIFFCVLDEISRYMLKIPCLSGILLVSGDVTVLCSWCSCLILKAILPFT